MSERGSVSTFRILLAIILFVTGLVCLAVYFGDKSITYCYNQITIVESGVGCPTPSPDK